MAIYHEDIVDIELEGGNIHRSFLNQTIGSGDKKANRFGVRVFRNGAPENVSGMCAGYFIRADGTTVAITDSAISGNVAYVTLPEACYAVEGQFTLAIKCENDGVISTMRIVDGVVSRTSTSAAVDPGTIIPSIEDLIETIDEAVASIPPDYSAFVQDFEAFEGVVEANGYETSPTPLPESLFVYENKIIRADGKALVTVEGYYSTDYVPILDNSLCLTGSFFPTDSYNTLVLYDAEKDPIYMARGTETIHLCKYPNAKYFRAAHDSNDTYYVEAWLDNDLERYYTSPVPVQLADGYYIYEGYILDASGAAASGFSTWAVTDFLRITARDVVFTGSFFPNETYHTLCLYNKNRQMIAHATGNDVLRVADYPAAEYFRAAHATDTDNYFVNISNRNEDAGILVNVGTGYEYTRLRDGIAAAIQIQNSTVIVHAGTYNLVNEFAEEIQAATGSAGITLANNVTVIFLAGSYVKALFSTSSTWISTYFEPFRGMNFTLDGLNIEASNCRYCVHDEQGGADVQYHNVYKNCVMKMTDDAQSGATFLSPQCIGGGLGKHGYIEIIGGYYASYGDSSNGELPPISYHNGYSSGCDGKIFIRDVYLAEQTGFFRFGYYGASTIKTKVMISGCSMGAAIMKRPETQDSTNDNFEIVEWNNIVRT